MFHAVWTVRINRSIHGYGIGYRNQKSTNIVCSAPVSPWTLDVPNERRQQITKGVWSGCSEFNESSGYSSFEKPQQHTVDKSKEQCLCRCRWFKLDKGFCIPFSSKCLLRTCADVNITCQLQLQNLSPFKGSQRCY